MDRLARIPWTPANFSTVNVLIARLHFGWTQGDEVSVFDDDVVVIGETKWRNEHGVPAFLPDFTESPIDLEWMIDALLDAGYKVILEGSRKTGWTLHLVDANQTAVSITSKDAELATRNRVVCGAILALRGFEIV